MITQRLIACLLIGWIALASGHAAFAEEPRTALVIGNAAYSFAPLDNPANDASDVAAALRADDFEVILKTDADQGAMTEAISSFGKRLKSRGGVGLFYYAGHGMQVSGENYMLPVSKDAPNETNLKASSVSIGEAVQVMTAANNALNIVILDACRNNPLSRGETRGLSKLDSSASLFVSFSTSPGALALDGESRNSPYSKHLVQSISVPNISIEEAFKRTLKGVYQETSGQQTPWISSSYFGEFVFKSTRAIKTAAPLPIVPPIRPVASPTTLAGIYRAEGINPNGNHYRGMVALMPAGDEFRFKWWIANEAFTGAGRLAGRMLVVNWGQKTPVVYTFSTGDKLDGEWADGRATETLDLFARAAAGQLPAPHGRYRVTGRNPDGTDYTGSVSITNNSGAFSLEWQVGSTYQGTGTLDGNILTVNWGSATPVIYALAADGTLTGLWSNGRGEETLTPE